MSGDTPTFDYDVFLSHNSKDKPLVRELAERLRADGLRVWLDEWVIKPGDHIFIGVEQGLQRSRTLVLVMSANAFGSDWVTLERSTALFRDPINRQRRFIPLLASDCEIPDTIRGYRYIDWREKADDAYQELLEACRPAYDYSMPREADVPPVAILERKLTGHTGVVWSVALTSDGQRAISGASDKTLKVWELSSGRCLATLEGHTDVVRSIALTSDGQRAISGARNKTLKVWELSSGRCLATLEGHKDWVNSVALTSDGQRAISGASDGKLKIWELSSGRCLATLEGHAGGVWSVALTSDGQRAISGASDGKLKIWELSSGRCLATLEGHTDLVRSIALTSDGQRAISGASDKTLKVWELSSGRCLATLEGHTNWVSSVALTSDGQRAISGASDKTLKVWDVATGTCLQTLSGESGFFCVAVSSHSAQLLAGVGRDIHVYRLASIPASQMVAAATPPRRYTNAKVVLVGESGVGKSGLAYRLAEDRWQVTESTHGMNVWPLHLPASAQQSDIEREVWLWDLAGQPEYRLVHQLFLDETAVALLLFNPQADDPFRELGDWEKALRAAVPGREPTKLLVAARTDRGGATLTPEKIERICRERGFAGYLATSAKLDEGCAELKDALARLIPWDTLSWTSTTKLFKTLKDAVVKLKDDDKTALIRFPELRQRLHLLLPDEPFEEADLRTVVGLLAGQALIKELDFGDFVLLQPQQMNNYAAAVVRAARDHTDGLACIPERAVLDATLDFKDLPRLAPDDEAILLRAMVQTFLDKSLCIREDTSSGVQLVFPSQYNRERDIAEYPAVLVIYRFAGELATLYTTLVVRLNYSGVFERKELWKNAAEFWTAEGRVVGLVMRPMGEGTGEIRVFFEAGVPDDTRVTFIKYIHEHLLKRAAPGSVERERQYVCPRCGELVENQRALKLRLEAGKKTIPCVYCDKPIPLQDLIETRFNEDRFLRRVQELDREADINLDNQSRELILVGHAFAVASEAGQTFRPTPELSHRGIDGEIEFKDNAGKPSGKGVCLQLKTGDSYRTERKRDGKEIFTIKRERYLDDWQAQAYPVYLVVRNADGTIRWMDVTEYLRRGGDKTAKQIVFDGEPFTFSALVRLRDRFIPPMS